MAPFKIQYYRAITVLLFFQLANDMLTNFDDKRNSMLVACDSQMGPFSIEWFSEQGKLAIWRYQKLTFVLRNGQYKS